MIPTIGRKVWFYPSAAETEGHALLRISDQPLDATVVHVNGPGLSEGSHMINVVYYDHCGAQHIYHDAELLHPDDELAISRYKSSDSSYCTWMPYQVKQVASDAK